MPLDLCLSRVSSPIGTLLLVCDSALRVHALEFEDHADRMPRLLRVHRGGADAYRLVDAPAPVAITGRLEDFFNGNLGALDDIQTETGGTSFQREVWSALRRIPAGTTLSYGQLAGRIGRPQASRAVGAANGSNPIAIIVPCHRVIGSGGNLTGYGGGVERKRWLLDHERQADPGRLNFSLRADAKVLL